MTPELKNTSMKQTTISNLACGLFAGALLLAGASAAQAQILVFDGFEQHNGVTGVVGGTPGAADGETIYGKTGPGIPQSAAPPAGGGWQTPWNPVAGITVSSVDPNADVRLLHTDLDPLAVTFAGAGTISGGTRAITLHQDTVGANITRTGETNFNGSDMWMAALIRLTDTPPSDGVFMIHLTGAAVAETDTLYNYPGIGIRNGRFVAQTNNTAIATMNPAGLQDPPPSNNFIPTGSAEDPQDYFLLAHFTWTGGGGGGGQYTASELWVYRDGSAISTLPPGLAGVVTNGPPMATASGPSGQFTQGNGNLGQSRVVRMRRENFGSQVIGVDSVILARNINDIVDGQTLSVDLLSFNATAAGAGSPVVITWETAAEHDNAGFNIYRAANGAPGQKLNAFPIAAQGTETEGASYSFVDSDPIGANEVRGYYLEDVEFSGAKELHGPVSVGPFSGTSSAVDSWAMYD